VPSDNCTTISSAACAVRGVLTLHDPNTNHSPAGILIESIGVATAFVVAICVLSYEETSASSNSNTLIYASEMVAVPADALHCIANSIVVVDEAVNTFTSTALILSVKSCGSNSNCCNVTPLVTFCSRTRAREVNAL
jgi:hypothetical protein